MEQSQRLDTYFEEANKHIELILEVLDELSIPINSYEDLPKIQRFAINALIFRFSKLQDLIGAKIFRNYLEFSGFNSANTTFYDILREIEKEGIINIDNWIELRELRNKIAHDYPQDLEDMLESINLFTAKSKELIEIANILEQKYNEIKRKRDNNN